jgi:hypothetical protein
MQIPLDEVIFLCLSFFSLGFSISALFFLGTIREILRPLLR